MVIVARQAIYSVLKEGVKAVRLLFVHTSPQLLFLEFQVELRQDTRAAEVPSWNSTYLVIPHRAGSWREEVDELES